jgi:tRNA1(Val) A37 N6-methylase TrmN6
MRRTTGARDSNARIRERGVSDPPSAAEPPVQNTLFSGQVRLWQPARGYRVNVDSLLLAQFAAAFCPTARHVVDLGAGVGGVTVAFAHVAAMTRCTLIEREPPLLALAERNLREAGIDGATVAFDLAEPHPAALAGIADVVLSNPPFFPDGARASGTGLRSRSRSGPLEPFLRAAVAVMGRRAHAFFAYPAPALPEIIVSARKVGLVAKRLRLVHAFATTPARLGLLELRRAKPGSLVVEPPVVEWIARGIRSPELEALVKGPPPRSPRS